MINLVLSSPNWSNFVHFSPTRSTLVLFNSFFPFWFTSVLFSPFCPLRPFHFTLVLFGPLCPLWSLSIQSYLASFWSPSVLFGPLCSIWSNLVHFDPLGSFFVHLHNKKVYVWVESTYFKSKFINCNMGNIYFCKHHWIIFIVGRFHAKVSNCNNFSAIHTKQLLQFQHFHQKMLRAISLLNQRLSCSKGHVN